MTGSRVSRKTRTRIRGTRGMLAVGAVAGALTLVAGVVLGINALSVKNGGAAALSAEPRVQLQPTTDTAAALSLAVTSSAEATSAIAVEVPSVAGKSVTEAEMLLAAAGLVPKVRPVFDEAASDLVIMQDPLAGAFVNTGATVVITVPSRAVSDVSDGEFVVSIDPGHQSRADRRFEPIGPGATRMKERVRAGTTGVSTGLPEYEVVLQISTNLKTRLEAAGVTVVMTRTTNDINISNAERAGIANAADADLFIRIHADGSSDASISGISTLYPAANQWTGPIAQASARAAEQIHNSTVAATGAVSRGRVARGDMTGFNHSRVPVVLIECGFMSHPLEDKLLASPHYQDKLAEGIFNGALAFLRETKR